MNADLSSERITLTRSAGRFGRFGEAVSSAWRKRWVKVLAVLLALPILGYFALWAIFARDLPSAESLLNYEPALPTYVRDVSGQPVQTFARERRVQLTYEEYPQQLIDAFTSAEDRTFFSHPGVDIPGIITAMFTNLTSDGRPVGASTITQQVAKNLLLTNEVTYTRKIRELFLARRIESTLTKEQILELYLNQIFLGRNAYGVQAAARAYFNKDVDELTLPEVAYLAVLPKAPSNYDPVRHPERAVERRNWVLGEMARNGRITAAQRDAAMREPLGTVRGGQEAVSNVGGYFMEEIRRQLIERFGATADPEHPNSVYAGGLWVRSSYDPRMQQAAEEALRDGLVRYERGRGWRDPGLSVDLSGDWRSQLAAAQFGAGYPNWRAAVVLSKSGDSAEIGFADGRTGTLPANLASMPRRGTGEPAFSALRPGAIVAVEQEGSAWALRSIPEISGAIVAEEVGTGRVLAMQGGFDSRLSDFNRATQAQRQPGSTFKPIVYAAALDGGMTPASIIIDGPFCVNQGRPGQYCFRNFSGGYAGPQTMRWGLEQSRNLMTVRAANQVGMDRVIRTSRQLGVGDYSRTPYLPISLGAGDTTALRLTNAYAILANQGRAVTPTVIDYVQDRRGQVIWRADTRPCEGCNAADWNGRPMPRPPLRTRQVIDAMTAYQVVHMLEGVVQRGTATILRDLDRPLFGKTGTTSGPTNVWFVGGSQQVVAGVYMGFDRPRPMGGYAQGGTLAAPIFRQFARQAFEGMPVIPFRAPQGIRMVPIDRRSGRRAFGLWPGTDPRAAVIWEAFKPESEPRRTATREDIDRGARREAARQNAVRTDRRDSDFLQSQGGIY
ncbi:PBP1A family penicillin-binding protein [Sphingosinicella sp. LHD-64]|uniref:penicillin-binding protein 1A n=1 Tax=Sphingosinicella sp. LHD-64 TaxID=3072139 RepID=UPI00280E98A1|nr:PBP1A family penicillin-binding protein [Sphingosinicella sp. LHD-64]MDQ8755752.1 PBP1A family penicillin-binding protein [Sphingosinicella sp. LHD-64]